MRLQLITALAMVCLVATGAQAQQTTKITPSGIGYLEYLPADYKKNTKSYPLVVFLHGIGERGTTSTDPATLKSSVQKVANVGLAKYIRNGTEYPFIVISPQLKSSYGTWPAQYVMDVLNYARKNLRVDANRIYITGLSLGGFGTWTTLAANPDVFAAAVPICSGGNTVSKACQIAGGNPAVWAFHGTGDKVVSYTVTTKMVNALNACAPAPTPLAKTTLFSGMGHNVWDKVYKETDAINWMTGFTRKGSGSSTPDNQPPVVQAGSNRTLTLPANEVYLQGAATDPDGSIATWKWTKVSGGTASLGGANTSRLRAYNLVKGTYTFRLTATDNKGASRSDDVVVTVNAESTTNVGPVAHAGPDRTTSARTITLNGSGTDKDGKITAYRWTQYGGAATTMTNANSASVTISGLQDGKYFFRLTVTDDKGATDYDNMLVHVTGSSAGANEPAPPVATNPAPAPEVPVNNIAPTANAGADVRTSASSVVLRGSGTDSDGRITAYKWIQYGGATASMANANSPNVTISGLREGRYYFRLIVTDDRGGTASDNVLVHISSSYPSVSQVPSSATSSPNKAPKANAGPDRRLAQAVTALKLYGAGTDEDGTVVSYQWTQYGGKTLSLKNSDAPVVTVQGLEAGKYYLRLTVEDNDGAVDYDNMLIVVGQG